MPLLHRLKTWLQKRKQGKNKQRSKGAKSATNASKVKSTPRFSEDSTYIFKRTLIRTKYGRIVTKDDDDVLDEDDVQDFLNIVNRFEPNHPTPVQIVKVTYLVNEKLHERYESRKTEFRKSGVHTRSKMVFHGTTLASASNIMRNGFKIGGVGGHPVRNGTNFGTGIYTDDNGHASCTYTDQHFCLVACQGLMGKLGKHTINPESRPNWFIFKNPDQLLPCYVIYFEFGSNYEPLLPLPQHFVRPEDEDSIEEILDESSPTGTSKENNEMAAMAEGDDTPNEGTAMVEENDTPNEGTEALAKETDTPNAAMVEGNDTPNEGTAMGNDTPNEENGTSTKQVVKPRQKYRSMDDYAAAKIFSSSMTTKFEVPTTKAIQKQLMRVLKTQMNTHEKERGWRLEVTKMERLDVWEVHMLHFDKNLPLNKDLEEHDLEGIVMNFTFPADYPTSPPFARVVSPRLLRFMDGGGGHVEAGGAICVELLTSSGWDPKFTMEGIFQIAHALLSTTEPPARLANNWDVPYTMQEAKDAFVRVAATHNWKVNSRLIE